MWSVKAHRTVFLALAILWSSPGCSSDDIMMMNEQDPLCQPGAAGPDELFQDAYWLTEGESIEIVVACQLADAPALTGDDFAFETLPAGATYDPATATLSWTPGLDQAAVHDLVLSVPGLADALDQDLDDARDESSTIRIGVADRFDDPDNLPIADPYTYTHEYGVPVFHLLATPDDPDAYTPTRIIHQGRAYTAEAKQRGRTSLGYPKNSYTLKFPKNYLLSEPEHDFLEKQRVVLTQPFDDNSYLRTRLAFDAWNLLDPTVQVQSYSAVVYIEGQFMGVYTASDHIDSDLMAAHGLPEAGNLYKATNHDANFRLETLRGDPKTTPHQGYEKKSGLPEAGQPGAFDDLDQLVQFVATSSDGEFAADLARHIDIDDYMSWLVLVSFTSAGDSGGKNSYHYHHTGTLWKAIPWDFNGSFGQAWNTRRTSVESVDYFEWTNEIFTRMRADPAMAEILSRRFRSALDGPFAADAWNGRIDAYLDELPDPVIARDQARWGELMLTFDPWSDREDLTTPAEEIDYIRTWLTERHAVYDALY